MRNISYLFTLLYFAIIFRAGYLQKGTDIVSFSLATRGKKSDAVGSIYQRMNPGCIGLHDV
jgi:hypothetical protein